MTLDWTVLIDELRSIATFEERLTLILDKAGPLAAVASHHQIKAAQMMEKCLDRYEPPRG